MVDLIIGIFVLLFLVLGLREGLVKTLLSILLVYIALFLSTAALNAMAKVTPGLADPTNAPAVCAFIVIWLITYIVLDLILGLLLRKVITVTVLGPLDKVAGVLLGAFKGMLIAGIILQLNFCFPVAESTRKMIAESNSVRFAIAAYQWTYPYIKPWSSYLGEMGKENLIEKIEKSGKVPSEISAEVAAVKKMKPEELLKNVDKYNEAVKKSDQEFLKILEDQNLLPEQAPGKQR